MTDASDDTRALCTECVHDRHERCVGNGCECPKCEHVMIRNSDNTYNCIYRECDLFAIGYKPVSWEMERVATRAFCRIGGEAGTGSCLSTRSWEGPRPFSGSRSIRLEG